MKDTTVGSLAEWIIKNRKGNAFKNNTLEDIVYGITEDVRLDNILYVLDDESEFIGVITFLPDNSNKILFVKNIVITRHAALSVFIQYFNKFFKNYRIAANRDDEYMEYNTDRMLHLLTILPRERS